MKSFGFKDFNLTYVLLLLFVITITGQALFGFKTYNEEIVKDGGSPLTSRSAYLTSPHFVSSVSENMESEFLQMALFVFLTKILIQKGNPKMKKAKKT